MKEDFQMSQELFENTKEKNLFQEISETVRKVIAVSMLGIATAQSLEGGAYISEAEDLILSTFTF